MKKVHKMILFLIYGNNIARDFVNIYQLLVNLDSPEKNSKTKSFKNPTYGIGMSNG